jgi:hypothetical protein
MEGSQLMFDPTGMILADKATRRHVLSARPDAPVLPEPLTKQRGEGVRRVAVAGLRRLADRLEPRGVKACASAS